MDLDMELRNAMMEMFWMVMDEKVTELLIQDGFEMEELTFRRMFEQSEIKDFIRMIHYIQHHEYQNEETG